MKKLSKNRRGWLVVFLSLVFTVSCNQDKKHNHKTDPSAASESANADSLRYLLKRTDEVVVSSIGVTRPQRGTRFEDLVYKGVINYDTRYFNVVSSRVAGRIEKLYIKYNYQQVKKGQKLMEVYSPDLANAQQELLFLKQNGDAALLGAARQKLRLLGATDRQISEVIRTGKVNYRVSIYSPYSGYITEGSETGQSSSFSSAGSAMITSAGTSSSGSMGGGMEEAGAAASASLPEVVSSAPLKITEGQYVAPGQRIFNIISNAQVRAEFYSSPEQLSELKKGEPVQVEASGNRGQHATAIISLVQPYYKEGTRFSLVRATISNASGIWKAGQIIEVKREGNRRTGNWLLRSAVLRLGIHYVVFVKEKGVFVPRYVKVLAKAGDWYDIGDSLSETAEVAENAWFLVDSESFVRNRS